MELIINFITSGSLWIALIFLFVISYLLLALFNWNFIKPFKYLGVSMIIVSILLILIKFFASFIISNVLSTISVPKSIIDIGFKPFLTYGIIYLIVGITLIIVESIFFKKIKSNEE